VLSINFSKPIAFEDALQISGKKLMEFDFLEERYQADDSTIEFRLSNEVESTGSRAAGYEARRKLENIMRVTGAKKVVVIGKELGVVSSSFADEFFAKLALGLGEDVARQLVSLSEFSALNLEIIAGSIERRRRLVERRGVTPPAP
jgi:hypothetical protein